MGPYLVTSIFIRRHIRKEKTHTQRHVKIEQKDVATSHGMQTHQKQKRPRNGPFL